MNIGDKVICLKNLYIKGEGTWLTKNNIYVITKVDIENCIYQQCKYHLSSIKSYVSSDIVYGPTLISKYYIGDYFMGIFQHVKLMRKDKLKKLEEINE